jgi:diguanylate cyclase (GGDEF)-like protein
MNLERMKSLLLTAVIVVVGVIGFVVYQGWTTALTNRNAMESQTALFNELESVRQGYRDAENLERDYLATSSPTKLDMFHKAVDDLNNHIANVQKISDTLPSSAAANVKEDIGKLEEVIKTGVDNLRALSIVGRDTNTQGSNDNKLGSDLKNRDAVQIDAVISQIEQTELKSLQNQLNREGWYSYQELSIRILGLSFFGIFAFFVYLALRSYQHSYELIERNLNASQKELTEAKAQLDRLSHFDFVTELLNVRGLERAFQAETNRAGRSGTQLLAIIVCCDNFKTVAEDLGHAVGDLALKEIARRIARNLRPADHVGRISKDEFLVILPESQLAFALRVGERIRSAISDSPFNNVAEALHIECSIGVATVPHRSANLDEVFTVARVAQRRSKGVSAVVTKNGVHSFEPNGTPEEIVEVLSDIRNYRTVFQPIMDLSTESIRGYEVYSRGPEGKFESPEDFFRACLDNNILTNVDLVCLKHCIITTRDAKSNLLFHINLFPSTLLDTPIETLISLFPAQRKGHRFCLELSEEKFDGDPNNWRDHINALKQAGILIAIDDVGFDISSLERLIVLEPDFVKVDRKYVQGITREPGKVRLLKRLANVGKSLGSEIIAEGIETREDLPILRELGIHYGQGYLWGKLLPALPTDAQPGSVRAERT